MRGRVEERVNMGGKTVTVRRQKTLTPKESTMYKMRTCSREEGPREQTCPGAIQKGRT